MDKIRLDIQNGRLMEAVFGKFFNYFNGLFDNLVNRIICVRHHRMNKQIEVWLKFCNAQRP